MKPEEKIQAKIREKLEDRGAAVHKTHGSHLSYGEPDLFVCYPWNGIGIFVAIEVKTPYTEPDKLQLARIRWWRAHGAIAFVSCEPDTIVDLIEQNIKMRMGNEGGILKALRMDKPR